MDEYIKRSAGASVLRAKANMAVLMDAAPYFEKAAQILEKLPAADVAPVVHAQWIEDGSGIIICPECKRGYNLIAKYTHYCPNCGAKMDGGGE